MDNGGMLTDCSNAFPALPNTDVPLPDWEYTMRRTMQEIVPNVFLGPYRAAVRSMFDYLKEHGITHIICIRHPLQANLIRANFPDHFKYLVLDIIDSHEQRIIHYFKEVKEFIDECLQLQGKVLMHGDGGMSRSAALMIAYMMETYGLPYKEAFGYVQQRRYCINPNEGFIRQLMEYEPIYMARYQQHQQQQQQQQLLNNSNHGDMDVAMATTNQRVSLKRPHGSDDEMEECPKRDRDR